MHVEEEADDGGCTTWKVVMAPIRTVLWLSIPDCKRHPKLFLLTFTICVAWIGTTTYVITWMITVVGENFLDDCLSFEINPIIFCNKRTMRFLHSNQ
jgi:hypothetical protein